MRIAAMKYSRNIVQGQTCQQDTTVYPQQESRVFKHFLVAIRRLRHPIVGYLLSFPLVGLALCIGLLGEWLLPHFPFFNAPLFLIVMVVALIWGTGQALLAVLVSTLVLDYFALPPVGSWSVATWEGLLQLLPFMLSGMIIALITAQRETARRRALRAEQEVQAYAHELEQANSLKDRFLSIASHELKTPMTAIRMQAQLLLLQLSTQPECSTDHETICTALEKIDGQVDRLNSLADDLLDLRSIHAGKIALQLEQCDLVEVCRTVVEEQRLLSGRTIELAVPSTPIMLQADQNRLRQVVTNLVSNGLKYSPEGCPVLVHISQHDDSAVLQVSDAGQGIPKDQRAHIFEPFYRTPEASRSGKPGLGLGLAICKEIVERHGGRIYCESFEGKGSTFFVELPLQ